MKRAAAAFFAISFTLSISIFAIQPVQAAVFESDTAFIADGTAKYAAAGNSTALRTFNAMTIEAWVKPTGTCTGNIATKFSDYQFSCSAGEISYAFGGTSTAWTGIVSSVTVPGDEWHHVAITRAASTNAVSLYLDGQLTSTGTADGAGTTAIKSTTTTFLNIGARAQGATYFNGAIDEVRIFNVARTEAQIASDMHTWGNLGLASVVGYYDFNAVSGSTISNKATAPDANSDLTISGSVAFNSIESTTSIGDQRVTTFPRTYLNSNGGWLAPAGVSRARALVIAGGGGGGFDEGGGGGAGGFIDTSSVYFAADTPIDVIVGQGGFGATGDPSRGENGQNSTFATLTTAGGGGGATSSNVNGDAVRTPGNGGSGGGGAGEAYTPRTAGTAISGQGFSGGAGTTSGAGGGGGGAGEAGNTNGASKGGDGKSSDITGSAVIYAGGGGGGNGNTAATVFAGGTGGGGAGGASTTAPIAGTANRGGGGGGGGAVVGGYAGFQYAGASGGSGVVIIRYAVAVSITISNLSYSVTPMKGINTTISFNTNVAGSVQVYVQGIRIKGCYKKATTGSTPTYSVSCTWKPAIQGQVVLKIVGSATDSLVSANSQSYFVQVSKRTTTR
jgi:hypothetical protein